jgi:hypothetical protein
MPWEGGAQNAGNESDATERQPLLPASPKLSPQDDVPVPFASSSANLRVILPALMVCAFLAAFDVTVVAAIYPIMLLSLLRIIDIL